MDVILSMTKKILIIAGETSGDTHGAAVVRNLRTHMSDMKLVGIGGDKMQQSGMELLYHIRDMSMMGFIEVIRHLPFIKKVMNTTMEWVQNNNPDAAILIDYPGFNLRLARKLSAMDIPVYYYISPQVWAWGKNRVSHIKKYIHKIFVIFPFEEDFYLEHEIPAEFVGHPLTEEIADLESRDGFFRQFGLEDGIPTIGLLPGSRKQEIERHLGTILESVRILNKHTSGNLQFCLALAPDLPNPLEDSNSIQQGIKLIREKTYEVMKYSTLVIVSSGSATLETAYFSTPMVIIYKMHWLTWLIGKLLVDMEYIGLANIVAGRKVVPELLQNDANPTRIANEALRFINDPEYYRDARAALAEVRNELGEPGAGKRVATAIYNEIYSGDD